MEEFLLQDLRIDESQLSRLKSSNIRFLAKKYGGNYLLFNKYFEQAKLDVLPFIKDPDSVSIWGEDFFKDLIKKIKYTD